MKRNIRTKKGSIYTSWYDAVVNSELFRAFVNYGLVVTLILRFICIIVVLVLNLVFGWGMGYLFIISSVIILVIYLPIIKQALFSCRQKLWLPIDIVFYLAFITFIFLIMVLIFPSTYFIHNNTALILISVQISIRLLTFVLLILYCAYWKQSDISAFLSRCRRSFGSTSTPFVQKNNQRTTNNHNHDTPPHQKSPPPLSAALTASSSTTTNTSDPLQESPPQYESDVFEPTTKPLTIEELPGHNWFQQCRVEKLAQATPLDFFSAVTKCSQADQKINEQLSKIENFYLVSRKTNCIIGVYEFYPTGNAKKITVEILAHYRKLHPQIATYIAEHEQKLLVNMILNVNFSSNMVNRSYFKYYHFATRPLNFVKTFNSRGYLVN